MHVFYSDHFDLPLPTGHRFPMPRYSLLRKRLQASEIAARLEFVAAPAATDEQLLLVHNADYLAKVVAGELSPLEQRRIGFPWSPEMVLRSRRSAGATVAAANVAMKVGKAVHLAGGTHHAFADHGQGFCVFNDVAVAIRVLQQTQQITTATVIDLDVHQGNGTAAIFAEDSQVFTFSMHGNSNYPFAKCDGDLDIGLDDGTLDAEYLAELEMALRVYLPLSSTDVVFYLAGADPYAGDRLGKLKLSKAGLSERDVAVMSTVQQAGCPLVVVMAGGYARDIEEIVDINAQTVTNLLEFDFPSASR